MIAQGLVVKSSMVTNRTHGTLMRKLNRQWATRQRFDRLPKHFDNVPETYPGAGGYRYKRRSTKYTKSKQSKHGHARPNVLTGSLRQAVLRNSRTTATQHKGTLLARGTPKHKLRAFQKREIEAVSRKERVEDMKRMERDYARLVQMPEYRAQRKRRSK